MIHFILFLIVGVAIVRFILTPYIKQMEAMDNRLQTKQTAEPQIEQKVIMQKVERAIEQKKDEMEQRKEKEEELFKLEDIANTRGAYRVKFKHLHCAYDVNGDEAKGKAYVVDISTTGMKIRANQNILFKPNLLMNIGFTFQQVPYRLKGVPLRKEKTASGEYEYGIVFVHDSTEQVKALHRALWEENRKRNRASM